jgi:Zn-dependent M28 family amino/carboxypeptidase
LAAELWIIERLSDVGIQARRDEVDLGGANVANIEATFPGMKLPDEIVIIGGHYDTVFDSPGANDNASGVALLLALAGYLTENPPERTVRVVFFVNEEWPFGGGIQMGSNVYAKRCKARQDRIVAMIAVDSVGCYSNEKGSQRYPAMVGWSLPSKGNFVAFGSNLKNRPLLDLVLALFQKQCRFPSIGAATDSPAAARSDHAPFWWRGYPAILMSDTSKFRDPNYHRPTDTPQHLNFNEMARMADGFVKTVHALALAETAIP